MTNELATTNQEVTDEGLDLLVKQARAMDAAYQLATTLCSTQMVPQTFRGKPDDGAAAILYGAELGLKPQQALQQVFVVHGQPAIYARTMVALLKGKGYTFETVDTSDTSVTVRGTSPRGEVEEATWTIDRAKKAGYTNNKKYQSDPQAMLYAKASSEVCRKLAPDVLLGIRYTAEDLELEPVKMQATRTDRPAAGGGAAGVKAALEAKKQEPVDVLSEILADIAQITEQPALEGVMERANNELSGDELQAAKDAANARYFELMEGVDSE